MICIVIFIFQFHPKYDFHQFENYLAFSACGFPGKESQRKLTTKVIEGTKAKEGAWPWQTFFFFNSKHSVDQVQLYVPGTAI